MSFIFSRALVEACLQGKCSDTAASALLSGSPTPPLFLPSDKTTDFSRLSRFGMTFGHLTDDLGAELLTSWLEGFPVKTSASQEKVPASPESAPACGPTWRGSLAKFDPATSSWKTVQPSLLGDSDECSVTWPRSGMTAGGQCWELPTLALPTAATGSGLWLPTPDTGTSPNGHGIRGGKPGNGRQSGYSLTAMAKHNAWPRPTVCGNYNRKGASPTSGDGLATAVLKFATPLARDWRSGKASQATHDKNSRPLSEQIGGALNPMWVEWLMGWPLGWTDLKPLETGKFLCAPQQPSECSLRHLTEEMA